MKLVAGCHTVAPRFALLDFVVELWCVSIFWLLFSGNYMYTIR